jgi:hypothetical protein
MTHENEAPRAAQSRLPHGIQRFSVLRPLEGLRPVIAPPAVTVQQGANGTDAVANAPKSSPPARATRFLSVERVPFATGHAEVLHYLFGLRGASTSLLRWEHVDSMRTNFVAEFETPQDAENALRHVLSFHMENRPTGKFLPAFNFSHLSVVPTHPADADDAGVAPVPPPPTVPFAAFSLPLASSVENMRSWKFDQNGVAFKIVPPRPSGRRAEPDTDADVRQRALAQPSRERSSSAWICGQVPSIKGTS